MACGNTIDTAAVKALQMARIEAEAAGFGLKVEEKDAIRPWGGFLRFTKDSLAAFLTAYWTGVEVELPEGDANVDPKVLLVAPGQVLSLQWHRRRGEKWRVIDGPVRIVVAEDWQSIRYHDYQAGEVIDIPCSQWHRLMGLTGWGRVAEIWRHVDPENPSAENDVLRVHDVYKRSDLEADPSTPLEQREAMWQKYYKG